MKKIVMGLSGGLDSATLLGFLLDEGYAVECCTFTYGSKHNEYENKAAVDIVNHYQCKNYPVVQHFFDLSEVFTPFKSNLLKSGGEIPEGHYNDESMRLTVVPGRNLILLSIMAGLAESIGAEIVALGIHSGDHFIYPDCRPSFFTAANTAIRNSTDGKVTLRAPFLLIGKGEVVNIGTNLEVPYELTRTCYKDQEDACGKCGSCVERLEAFKNNNLIDPVKYAK